jgi:hypothetical protein
MALVDWADGRFAAPGFVYSLKHRGILMISEKDLNLQLPKPLLSSEANETGARNRLETFPDFTNEMSIRCTRKIYWLLLDKKPRSKV